MQTTPGRFELLQAWALTCHLLLQGIKEFHRLLREGAGVGRRERAFGLGELGVPHIPHYHPKPNPKARRTHRLRLLGPTTILYKAFGLF